ncbi:hypothetical protein [Pseudoclavibacter sp. AY1F1]|uniref:hypothetical protein n=1 Tax=Pseudoclavibacter sp. AY1F1 TaxID=2080583 RepID=UPI0011B04AE9|nr:hypothetical protein [Pseudoclavibacter sp. AY1F1]
MLREEAQLREASPSWSAAAISARFVASMIRLLCARSWAASARAVSDALGVRASYAVLADACWSGAAVTSEGVSIRSHQLHNSGIYVVWVGE